jgi:hypothetical protein
MITIRIQKCKARTLPPEAMSGSTYWFIKGSRHVITSFAAPRLRRSLLFTSAAGREL